MLSVSLLQEHRSRLKQFWNDEMLLLATVLVADRVEEEAGPPHQPRPEEASQRRRSHRGLCSKYLVTVSPASPVTSVGNELHTMTSCRSSI